MKQQQTELQFEAPKTVRRPTAHRAGGRTCSSMRRDTQTHTDTDIAHLQKSALLLVSLAWSLLAKTKSNTNNNQTETRFELNWNRRMAANGDRAKKQWNSGQNTFPAQTSARHSKREPEKEREGEQAEHSESWNSRGCLSQDMASLLLLLLIRVVKCAWTLTKIVATGGLTEETFI